MNLVAARPAMLAALIAVCLSPVAKSASSDTWANDQPGQIRLGDIAPGSSASASGVAQGNIGATQSGPGAAGLFTPNNPGNAAAYNAQMTGALEGSPIVDGSGANIHVSVPMATPSETPGYLQYTVGTTTPDNRNSYMHYGVRSTNPPFTPGFTQGAYSDMTNVFYGTSPGAQITPEAVRPPESIVVPPTLNSPAAAATVNITTVHAAAVPQAASAARATQSAPIRRPRRAVQRLATASGQAIPLQHRISTDPLSLLGRVNGSMEYDDNQIVLFGANGTLRVNNDRTAVLTLTNGQIITYRDPANSLHQLAAKHVVPM